MGLPWNAEAKRLVSSVMQDAGIKGAKAKVVSDYRKSLGGFVGSFAIPRTKESVEKDILEGGDGEIKNRGRSWDIGKNLVQTEQILFKAFKKERDIQKSYSQNYRKRIFAPVTSGNSRRFILR